MSHCLNITWGCRYVVNSKSTWDHCFSYWRNMVLIIIHNCLYFLCQSQFSAHKCLVLPNKRHCSAVCGSHRVIGFAGLPLDVYQPDHHDLFDCTRSGGNLPPKTDKRYEILSSFMDFHYKLIQHVLFKFHNFYQCW